ncbi:MAG: HlyC/CorC family transporter [Chthonomonas sp.]|nr:HlyC/CorC family transporter [Chthonomonas sp.]
MGSSSNVAGGIASVALILANCYFVAAEYGLIGSRKGRLEPLAKKGSAAAKLVLGAMEQTQRYVAGIQVAITLCGLGIGSVAEPLISESFADALGQTVPRWVSVLLALLVATYVVVVIAELVPKYLAIRDPERVAMRCIRPLRLTVALLTPLAWLVERSGAVVLRPFGINVSELKDESLSRQELLLLVKSGANEGVYDEAHSRLVQKALMFDHLDAADIMIHRLDVKWVDVNISKEGLIEAMQANRHSRLVVCDGDIDNVVGILYLQDLIRSWGDPQWNLVDLLRKPDLIPENLNLNRVIQRMRDAKTQILMVADEYGGTSGLITLEDVVEEVFGELDDAPESDRPAIEAQGPYRLSIRADVRYDEILEFLQRDNDEVRTDAVAAIIAERLGKLPKLGDRVDDELGTFRVENMTRRRVTRVVLQLKSPAQK